MYDVAPVALYMYDVAPVALYMYDVAPVALYMYDVAPWYDLPDYNNSNNFRSLIESLEWVLNNDKFSL